jgi:hypothetical protein
VPEILPLSATFFIPREGIQEKKPQLALALARGISAADWAGSSNVPERLNHSSLLMLVSFASQIP